jgi:molybdenum cofactor cytidylyltransferase
MKKNISAVILSAGASLRMGCPKALLPMGGTTFIGTIAREISDALIGDTVIVLGAGHAAIRQTLTALHARIVINQAWETGRLSSIVAGIDALEETACDGALIWPVDHPLVTSSVVREMLCAFEGSPQKIIIPVCGARRGHPIILPRLFFDDVRRAPAGPGLRAVVHAHAKKILEVPTSEKGILINIDTPEDYALHCAGS